ncbi:hypothetical protein [Solirubrum puertoriconensis]|uniref:Fibronectin type-III domain-containing protein n=1 Tax=Solirubrum puertoriconensis TaxID=1751427 RepID=A0A9X0HMK9_SOLP1|nr:hypothetical protein [Solirubrum puertoriconensis]KUG08724.1 hypothetical protein ASU33_11330 [Solirubrum puertoriconensis]
MKTFTLLALLLGSSTFAAAQSVVSISAARAAGPGASVTIRGVVVNGAELGSLRYIQDKDAGIAAFTNKIPEFATLVAGDSVQLSGTLKNYNGLLEVDPVTAVTKLASKRRLRTIEVPAASLTSVYNEANEGRLVKIVGVNTLTTTGGNPLTSEIAGNMNYLINGQAGAIVRINSASVGPDGIVGKALPSGKFDLIGIIGQHSPSGTPTGYQLLPRLKSDMEVDGGMPSIVGTPVPTEIGKTGFTVHFNTINPGSTKVEYGTSSNLGSVITNADITTDHVITLSNLEPATVYYVRVSSTNAKGTSVSEAVPMITDSKNRVAPKAKK